MSPRGHGTDHVETDITSCRPFITTSWYAVDIGRPARAGNNLA